MAIVVRPMNPEDAGTFLEIQRASVREVATRAYPPQVIEAWAAPPTPAFLAEFLDNRDGEIRLIAELDGRPAGIGALVPRASELRACYVAPHAVRRGVGTAIVLEIERLARMAGVAELRLLASVNAEGFYAALGYQADGPTEFVLASGQPMAALRMHKRLPPP